MNPSVLTIDRASLDKVQSTASTLLLIGSFGAVELHVLHAVACPENTLVDMVADARESLPLGLCVVGLAVPKARENTIAQLLTATGLKLQITRGDDPAQITAVLEGKRLAVSGSTQLEFDSAIITWFRPPSGLTRDQIEALLPMTQLVDRGAGKFTVAAPPLRGVHYSRQPFVLRAVGLSDPMTVTSSWKADVRDKGIVPWVWAEAKPFCARFCNDGITAGEVVVAMRDTFGVRIRTKDVKFPAGDDEDEPQPEKAEAKDAPQQYVKRGAKPAARFDNRTLLIIILALVFFAAVSAVLIS